MVECDGESVECDIETGTASSVAFTAMPGKTYVVSL
jgi:hypothetical protein